MTEIPIAPSQFLYTAPITIMLDKDVNTPFKKLIKESNDSIHLTIQFAGIIPSYISETKSSLFKTNVADNKILKVVKVSQNTITIPNIAIAKCFTINLFKMIVAYIFNVNVSAVTISHPSIMDDSLIEYTKLAISDFRYCSRYNANNKLVIDDTISIGDAPMEIHIIHNIDSDNNNYEDIFYNEYFVVLYYIHQCLTNFKTHNVSTLQLPLYITQITVGCIYNSMPEASSTINITKLFNIHNTDKFSKIYIHSFDNDTFIGASREYQHVKTSNETSNVFKGIESLYDTCSMYIGLELYKGLILHHINVNSNMTVEFVFNNINNVLLYNDIIDIISKWINESCIDMIRKLKLAECIYSIDFDYNHYVPFIANVSASINMNNIQVKDIDSINELIQQYICNIKFKTRSSIQLNMYKFITHYLNAQLAYFNNIHEFMTVNIMFKDVLPTIHIGLNGDTGGTITLLKASSMSELIFNTLLVVGCFAKIVPSQHVNNTALSLDEIRKKSSKYGKKLLKLLESIDPRLFGARVVKGKNRSYSGLCQKNNQRPVPITIDEYEFLKSIVPDSVTNIRNQTYPEQRLCLFCPSKTFSFLNYHVFQNQLCIIRCTTKASNKTQYNFCSSAFDAEYQNNIQNKYENQTITLYNPIITPGRKCKLPDELKHIFVNYILLKLLIRSGIQQYCLSNYDKRGFIIMRDPKSHRYDVLTEYDDTEDYVLVIQSEVDDEYFIVLNEINGKPLAFSENDEVRKFFSKCVHKTSRQYNFFNYINDILKIDLTKYYNQSIRELITTLKTVYKLNFVISKKYIRGIVWKNMFIMTPQFYWIFDESDYTNIPLFKAISLVQAGKMNLPKYNMLINKRISKLYVDFNTRKIHMVQYQNTPIMIEPVDILPQMNDITTVIFDASTIEDNLSKIIFTKSYSGKSGLEHNKFNGIAEIINSYLFMFLMKQESVTLQFLEEQLMLIGVVYNQKTFISYADPKSQRFISWRASKINNNDLKVYFEKYGMLTTNDCIKYIYKHIHDSMNLVCEKNERIESKILTL